VTIAATRACRGERTISTDLAIDVSFPGMDKPEPDIFDEIDEEAEARSEAEADADVAAGRVVSNARVVEWLKSWGTDHELPTPYSWRK